MYTDQLGHDGPVSDTEMAIGPPPQFVLSCHGAKMRPNLGWNQVTAAEPQVQIFQHFSPPLSFSLSYCPTNQISSPSGIVSPSISVGVEISLGAVGYCAKPVNFGAIYVLMGAFKG